MDIAQLVKNASNRGFDIEIPVNRSFATSGDGYWSCTVANVQVHSINMFISLEPDEDNWYGDSDLGILHEDGAGLTWDTERQGLIYTDNAFIKAIRSWLVEQGFDADAVNDIGYSEQGMQEQGRVSCDAYKFANMLRQLYNDLIILE